MNALVVCGCRVADEEASRGAKEILNRRLMDAELPYELRVTEATLVAYVK